MALNLKIVKGHTPNERMKSVDGLLSALDGKLRTRGPDERLVQEVADLKRTITTLLDHLGLVIDAGPKKVIRQVRLIEDETGPDNPL